MGKLNKEYISFISVVVSLCIITVSIIYVRSQKDVIPVQASSVSQLSEVSESTSMEAETTTESTMQEESSEPETETTKTKTTKTETTTKKVTTTTKKETTTQVTITTEVQTENITEIVTLENGETVTVITGTKPVTTTQAVNSNSSHEIAGSVPQKAAVSGSWFDDAVFVGDSVSLKLSYYEGSVNRLGKAQFLVAGSLSATNALWDVSDKSVHPRYNGKKQKIEDSISQMNNVKKVYIMLGMNDIGMSGIDGGVKNLETLCNRILAKSPNVQIYIQSVTPMAKGSNVANSKEGKLNNNSIIKYNQKLAALAGRRGWYFINVASVMYDSENYLKREYCSDLETMGIHFTNEGCKVWVDYLLTHTP